MPATRRSKSKLNSDLAMAKMKPAAIISERKSGEKRYWLMKSEPESRIVRGMDIKFSIDDLERDRIAPWDGVVFTSPMNACHQLIQLEKLRSAKQYASDANG